ncbi:hypothetical protein CNBB3360 [Cryptococcus deneoformans B-3501A]|uniref:hypothetical protein n=1 Tax=Cryptococcus deneoformans (strain B-3501A) TaxID=283643 RepID=UPI000042C6BB|nr:hypothetical protein CNBB3360 [Cryptococcus neoformans var. neoformans B-3501A]EAL22457.1 hypothetical protein CNBB3360 [Cryptococcus neoformans var. neoformans B-3501A]
MHSFCGDRRLRKGFGPMMTCVDRGKMAATYSLCTADCLVMTFIDGQLCLWPDQEHYIVAYPQRCKVYHGQQDRSSRPHHSRSSVHPFLASGSLSSLLAHPRHPSALFKEIIYCLLFDPRWCHLLRTWKCENVLLDVEVHFEGESGELDAKLLRGKDGEEEYQLIKVEGDQIIPSPFTSLSLPYATLSSHQSEPYILEERQSPGFPVVALGGTFDRLHAAHKLLLHLGYFLAREKLIVGVMADDLLHTKTRADLVQPLNQRLDGVNAFLGRLGDGSIKLNVVEIHDALGPTRSDPNVQALVVSRETLSGGEYVNSTRKEGGLQELELFVVDVIAENGDVNLKEEMDEGKLKKMKMGSTGVRNWIAERGTGEQDR